MFRGHSLPHAGAEFLVCEKAFASGPQDLRVARPWILKLLGPEFQRAQVSDFNGCMSRILHEMGV